MKSLILFSLLSILVFGCSRPSELVDASGPRSFEENQKRYMAPLDILTAWRKAFPVEVKEIAEHCRELTAVNRGLIGDNSPSLGGPVFGEPSDGFGRWYMGCLLEYTARLALEAKTDAAQTAVLFGASGAAWLKNKSGGANAAWTSVPSEVRLALAIEQINRLIGPDTVLSDLGDFDSAKEMAEAIFADFDFESLSFEAGARKILFEIARSDEFLTY